MSITSGQKQELIDRAQALYQHAAMDMPLEDLMKEIGQLLSALLEHLPLDIDDGNSK